jgi:hypothetical protein
MMNKSHTGRMVLAGALLLGIAGAVGACSDPPPTTTTTVERTTTVTPVQPPSTVTTTHVRQSP